MGDPIALAHLNTNLVSNAFAVLLFILEQSVLVVIKSLGNGAEY
jgi:hypothetical protein